MSQDLPIFQIIKNHILKNIQAGLWKEGDSIPSEPALAREFNVSRMTVNRAVRELTTEQILIRVQGSGTYVAQQKYQGTLVAIKSIADEIRTRGHRHRSELHLLVHKKADELMAKHFKLKLDDVLFHSIIIHFENDIPIQVEDRWVNPNVAPDYMKQDFSQITANEYLMQVAPLEGVQYQIEAIIAPANIINMLQINKQEPCLVLHRKTLSMGAVASVATMWHPANRYQFTGAF